VRNQKSILAILCSIESLTLRDKKEVIEIAPTKPLREEGEESDSEDNGSGDEQSELLRRYSSALYMYLYIFEQWYT
jgi:hypothetical protein